MPVFWFPVFFRNLFLILSFNTDFLRFLSGSPGSFDFSCQDTNSVSSFNFCACRKPSGCWLPIMLFRYEFQPSTALLVLCRYWRKLHISIGTFCFCIITGHCNQEIRLISHSVEHCCDHKPTFLYFLHGCTVHIFILSSLFIYPTNAQLPVPVAARSKA